MDSPKVKRIAKIPEWLKELKLQKAGIGIYCRVSTSEQRQLRSLSNQITSLIKTVQGWDCLPYLKDVYVDIMSAINDIRHAGGYVYFEVENLDTKTQANDHIIAVMGGVAQEESYFKSKNIKFGIRESLKNPDSRLYNRCCYGYRYSAGRMVPEPYTARVVKDIFEYYKYGRSLSGIARILEDRWIESPSGKRIWRTKTIENILKNEKYVGNVVVKASAKDPVTNEGQWFKVVGHHEGIIKKSLFDEVQRLFVERSNVEIGSDGKKKRKSTHYSSKKPYTGLTKDKGKV